MRRKHYPWDPRPPRWNDVPKVERPEHGWPVWVVERCNCPPWVKAMVGPLSFHEDAAGLARCYLEGSPITNLLASRRRVFRPYDAFVDGVGWYAFVQNSPGHHCVTLHHTLDEAKAHRERYFESIGQCEPESRHWVLDLTKVASEGDLMSRLRRTRALDRSGILPVTSYIDRAQHREMLQHNRTKTGRSDMKSAEELIKERDRLRANIPALAAWIDDERAQVQQEVEQADAAVQAARDELTAGPTDTASKALAEQMFSRVWPGIESSLKGTYDLGIGAGRQAIENADEVVRPLVTQAVIDTLRGNGVSAQTVDRHILVPTSPGLRDVLEVQHRTNIQALIARTNLDQIEAGTDNFVNQ